MKMNKKGITLVEVIVVLLIMGILAGIVVTTYTGYLDRAHEKTAMVEARAVQLAAVTVYNEEYATKVGYEAEYGDSKTFKSECAADVAKLAGVAETTITELEADETGVTKIVYTASNGTKCTYTTADGWKFE